MTFNPEFTGAELTDDQFNQLCGVLGSDEWAFAFSAMQRRWPQLAELVRSNAPDLPDDLVGAVEILSAKPLPTDDDPLLDGLRQPHTRLLKDQQGPLADPLTHGGPRTTRIVSGGPLPFDIGLKKRP
ncbi:MAG: hypothetical protein HYV27_00865 [Candidatus Hydrogenedentes bacterium]|nr:hypothetical protein [Candidatus Hydrogenedentota bacterium]